MKKTVLSTLIIIFALVFAQVAKAECCYYSASTGCTCNNEDNPSSCKTYTDCIATAPLCGAALTCSNTYGSAIANLDYASCPDSNNVCQTPHSKSMPAYCRQSATATRLTKSSVKVCFLHLALTSENAYGEIETPVAIDQIGDLNSGGPMNLINLIITFLTFLGAFLLFVNIVLAGIKIITGGQDPKNFSDQMKRIVWSVVGLVLIALAYLITGFVSGALFGDDQYLLNPTINEPSSSQS